MLQHLLHKMGLAFLIKLLCKPFSYRGFVLSRHHFYNLDVFHYLGKPHPRQAILIYRVTLR